MAEETDFFQLLKAIGGEAGLFAAAVPVARKAVNEIVRVQLAAAGTGLDQVKRIRALLGPSAFSEALDGVQPPKLKALMARVDPHASAIADAAERIKALLALADGSRIPSPAPEKAPRRAGTRKATPRNAAPPLGQSSIDAETPVKVEEPAAPKRRATGRRALRVSEER
ncbi:hypothetical protein ACI7BZ_17645 [Xanthobacter sp. AM11]|uniref:hypothetical protein n=1 Tax=Xanthobacter sp. AM11 TaxID=3380643 RepID=UPI0039BF8CA9